jgi:hypothetical protein
MYPVDADFASRDVRPKRKGLRRSVARSLDSLTRMPTCTYKAHVAGAWTAPPLPARQPRRPALRSILLQAAALAPRLRRPTFSSLVTTRTRRSPTTIRTMFRRPTRLLARASPTTTVLAVSYAAPVQPTRSRRLSASSIDSLHYTHTYTYRLFVLLVSFYRHCNFISISSLPSIPPLC